MAGNKKSFILYSDLLSVVEKLVIKDRENKTNFGGELFLHILKYVNDKEPVPIDFIIEMAFEPIRLQLKRDLESYEVMKEKRSFAGKKSAEIKKQNSTKSTSVESVKVCSTNSTDNVTVNDNDNVNGNDILLEKETKDFSSKKNDHVLNSEIQEPKKVAQKKEIFKPPELFEVQAYCIERKNNISPESFFNFYESKGWMVGKNKMISWKAAIRNWETKEKQNGNNYNGNNGNNKISGTSAILNGLKYTEFT